MIKVIVGLGNPGREYERTRHNAGFLVLDKICQKLEINFSSMPRLQAQVYKGHNLLLIKPQTFMNESGRAVRAVIDYFLPALDMESLFIIHDDLDLEIGKTKTRLGSGPKEHGGLLSIYQYLNTENFWHVRIGVDARKGERLISGSEYVLGKFSPAELEIIEDVSGNVAESLIG